MTLSKWVHDEANLDCLMLRNTCFASDLSMAEITTSQGAYNSTRHTKGVYNTSTSKIEYTDAATNAMHTGQSQACRLGPGQLHCLVCVEIRSLSAELLAPTWHDGLSPHHGYKGAHMSDNGLQACPRILCKYNRQLGLCSPLPH